MGLQATKEKGKGRGGIPGKIWGERLARLTSWREGSPASGSTRKRCGRLCVGHAGRKACPSGWDVVSPEGFAGWILLDAKSCPRFGGIPAQSQRMRGSRQTCSTLAKGRPRAESQGQA
uniref:Uncharacterized protein n=1 Tax=Tetraselmis sp. GSL018 TaxID=582737 RepID=A0A061SG22_9CHLO